MFLTRITITIVVYLRATSKQRWKRILCYSRSLVPVYRMKNAAKNSRNWRFQRHWFELEFRSGKTVAVIALLPSIILFLLLCYLKIECILHFCSFFVIALKTYTISTLALCIYPIMIFLAWGKTESTLVESVEIKGHRFLTDAGSRKVRKLVKRQDGVSFCRVIDWKW